MPDLSTTLGRLRLANPVLVASATFGYARELAGAVDFAKLGGIIPKTVTKAARAGNPPPRTVETPSGMLNAIGLDNDGIEHFIHHHLPYLRTLPSAIIGNIEWQASPKSVARPTDQCGNGARSNRAQTNVSSTASMMARTCGCQPW